MHPAVAILVSQCNGDDACQVAIYDWSTDHRPIGTQWA
ncbi:hypothetical protein STBA_08840 [Streptomyces sp. MP131-18]|nr:hypothetical protein STBA_08840 [Streptomyces sp. MP131-18]